MKRPVDLDYVRFVSDLSAKTDRDKSDEFDELTIIKFPKEVLILLYRNTGTGSFRDESDLWGTGKMKGYFNGAAYADLDNDGNLDLVMNCINSPAVILKNNSGKKGFLSLSFKGEGMNKFGIGAKAWLWAHDNKSETLTCNTRS